MKSFLLPVVLLILSLSTFAQQNAAVFADIEKQTSVMLQEIPAAKNEKPDLVSPRTIEKGNLKVVSSRDWTSGFFPGQLWMLYEYTGKPEWKTQAQAYTANLEREKTNGGTHDMGFKMYCSYGSGYRLTKDPQYREILIQSAKTLCTRFRPITGCIRSWDHNGDKWAYPVIIDNMMNLELLFAATQFTGDSSFYKIAVTHANTTMKNHYRADYSSWHVVDYDTVTGQVIKKNTHQGYADESTWARGNAWGLYGYVMCYRFTKDKTYLQHAERIANYLLKHPKMPADLVPYWDFNDPTIPDAPRDASAAAIMASALLELSTYSKNGKSFAATANKILDNLTKNYRSAPGENKGFLLLHSTGHKPYNSEIDVPINYADYYYLEGLLRSKKLKEKKKLF